MVFTSEVSIGVHRSPMEALDVALSRLQTSLEVPRRPTKVLIKPSIYDPRLVGNTHVSVVKAVLNAFKTLGPAVIVESDNPRRRAIDAFQQSGYNSLFNPDVSLVNLSELDTTVVKMPGNFFKEHKMPTILTEEHFFINVPTVKLEPDICTIGGGIKNLFGLIPEVEKSVYHQRIDDVLMDLLAVFRPQMTIVDLTSLVIGDRIEEVTKEIGAIVVGADPVAVDAFCADLLGIDAIAVSHLRRAYELGLGEIVLDRIRVSGTATQKQKLLEACKH
ncbi:MAG: hypothetical protein C4K48_06320 [Candidatus Thorarchaeota archaeon]|nr:MAG: hypothetical protein C4K48_06320 [Candidatus Thorarchaeota archaeon]